MRFRHEMLRGSTPVERGGLDAEYGRPVSGWRDRRFLDLVGCEHPIIQAPMANAGGVDLCVAAIKGGALGSLPCGMLDPDQIREQATQVRARASGPMNLNFLAHEMPEPVDDSRWRELLLPYYRQFGMDGPPPSAPMRVPFDAGVCAVVEEIRPDVVSFHFGLPEDRLLERVRSTGAVILSTATTVDEARVLEQRGVAAIIAQGLEAGGHSGRFLASHGAEPLTLLALLPQVTDAVQVPVIAAGGVADGRGVAAAFMLGASAVQLGTAYLHCPESLIADPHRDMLRDRGTVMTTVYSGGPARAIRGRLVDEIGAMPSEAPPYPLAGAAAVPLFRAAIEAGNFDLMPILAGQASPLGIKLPAEELTRSLALEAFALMELGGTQNDGDRPSPGLQR